MLGFKNICGENTSTVEALPLVEINRGGSEFGLYSFLHYVLSHMTIHISSEILEGVPEVNDLITVNVSKKLLHAHIPDVQQEVSQGQISRGILTTPIPPNSILTVCSLGRMILSSRPHFNYSVTTVIFNV